MQRLIEQPHRWLLSAVLILFILFLMTLPLVPGITYSGRSEIPSHTLTYTEGELMWDSASGIGDNGAAELDLFNAVYPNAVSRNGEKIVTPGTNGFNIIRLKNSVSGSVKYTAVLYRIRTSDVLPVEARLDGEFTDTDAHTLPDGVSADQVVRAVTGTVQSGGIQDFDISWLWQYFESDDQDVIDTMLGIANDPDEVTVGLYIAVEDNNIYVSPEAPETGDERPIVMYVVLVLVSLSVLILLLRGCRKEKECA